MWVQHNFKWNAFCDQIGILQLTRSKIRTTINKSLKLNQFFNVFIFVLFIMSMILAFVAVIILFPCIKAYSRIYKLILKTEDDQFEIVQFPRRRKVSTHKLRMENMIMTGEYQQMFYYYKMLNLIIMIPLIVVISLTLYWISEMPHDLWRAQLMRCGSPSVNKAIVNITKTNRAARSNFIKVLVLIIINLVIIHFGRYIFLSRHCGWRHKLCRICRKKKYDPTFEWMSTQSNRSFEAIQYEYENDQDYCVFRPRIKF